MAIFHLARIGGAIAAFALAAGAPISAVHAQPRATATTAQATAPNNVQLSPNPSEFALTALRIAMAVEQGQSGAIWDSASSVMRTNVPRDEFINALQQKVSSNGPLKGLTWRSVTRVPMQQPQGQLPAGQYLTVDLVGINLNNQPVNQTVSFILERDQQWRLIGLTYS